METVDYRTTRQKIEDAGRFVKRKAREGFAWAKENKDITVVLIPAVTGFTFGVIKLVGKAVNNRKEEIKRKKYIYDPTLGFYWPTKRALSGAEKLEFDARRKQGETVGEILRSMKNIKL